MTTTGAISRPRPGRDAEPRLSDYETERATFRLEVPERYNPVLDIVEGWAAEDPDAPAVLTLIGGEQTPASTVRDGVVNWSEAAAGLATKVACCTASVKPAAAAVRVAVPAPGLAK